MNTANLVDRMLKSTSIHSKIKAVDNYLLAFGVVKPSKDLPLVFDAANIKQWDAFVLDRKYSSKDPKERLLLTILDFVKFMLSQKINPFLIPTKIKVVDVQKSLFNFILNDSYSDIKTYFRKSGLGIYLKVASSRVMLSLDRKSIILTFEFTPITGDLTKVIQYDLKGMLYKTSKLPKQLEYSDKLSTFNTLAGTTSVSQWLPLLSVNDLKYYAKLSRNSLAVRVIQPVNTDYVRTPKELQTLVTQWKKIVK